MMEKERIREREREREMTLWILLLRSEADICQANSLKKGIVNLLMFKPEREKMIIKMLRKEITFNLFSFFLSIRIISHFL
jgi:hypothetical protein